MTTGPHPEFAHCDGSVPCNPSSMLSRGARPGGGALPVGRAYLSTCKTPHRACKRMAPSTQHDGIAMRPQRGLTAS